LQKNTILSCGYNIFLIEILVQDGGKLQNGIIYILGSISVNFSPFEKYKLILNGQKHYLE
jgi:hypothetical protein